MKKTYRVGDKITTWFGGQSIDGHNMSIIIEVKQYTGKYPQYFSRVLKVTAPRTKRGWMELCV